METKRKPLNIFLTAAALAGVITITSCTAETTPKAVDQPSQGAIAYRLPGCRVEPVVRNEIKPGSNPPEFQPVTRANFIITPPPGGEVLDVYLAPIQSRYHNSSIYAPLLGPIVTYTSNNDPQTSRVIGFDYSCNPLESAQYAVSQP